MSDESKEGLSQSRFYRTPVVRIFFYVLGVVGIAGGIYAVLDTVLSADDKWQGLLGGISVTMAGYILLLAAIINFRGHWAFVTGLGLLAFACFAAGSEIDDHLAGRSEDLLPPPPTNVVRVLTCKADMRVWQKIVDRFDRVKDR